MSTNWVHTAFDKGDFVTDIEVQRPARTKQASLRFFVFEYLFHHSTATANRPDFADWTTAKKTGRV